MAIYTVLAPASPAPETPADPARLIFVKEGFCWPALFVGPLWLIYRRLWLVLVLSIVVAGAIAIIGSKVGGPLPVLALVLAHFLYALEGNELRRWTLGRHGYRLIDVAEGRGIEEAEIHFFARTPVMTAARPPLPPMPPIPPVPPTPPAPPVPARPPSLGRISPSAEAGDVVGLFPAPGGASS